MNPLRSLEAGKAPWLRGACLRRFAAAPLAALVLVSLSPQAEAANAAPVARATAVQTKNSYGVSFDGSRSTDTDGAIVDYRWDYGDGSSGTGAKAAHTYAGPGMYAAKLTVIDNGKAPKTASTTLNVKVDAAPVPVYQWSHFDGEQIIVFAGGDSYDTDGNISAYTWEFGDGTKGSGQDTSHMYAKAGDYQVKFTVRDNFGNTASKTFTVTVKPKYANQLPVARASAAQVAGTLGVAFDGAASSDPDGSIASYAWNFGDGSTGSGAKTTHTYGSPGQYAATLMVTDNAGAKHSVNVAVNVAAPNQAPVARMSTAQATGTLGVAFDASASTDADGSIASYVWDFGDGATASGVKPSHTYAAPGQYTVSLTVTDNGGLAHTLTLPVVVRKPGTPAGNTPWVSGYYAGWFWADYQPQNIDMTAMTHVIFGRVAPGGGTLGGTPGTIVPGAGTAHQPGHLPAAVTSKSVEDYLIERAHGAGIKALLMLGGADDGAGFFASTAPAVRATFINNLLNYLVAHDYDGVDVDWEDRIDSPEEIARLLALIRELKTAAANLPRYQAPNQPLLVLFPTYVLNMNTDSVQPWKVEIAGLVDQFNLMSYQMSFPFGGWTTWHFAPIGGQGPTHPSDISSSVQAYVNAGIPRSKIGIGIGFYGAAYAPPVTGPDQTPSENSANDFAWSYANMVKGGFLSSGTYTWDPVAQMGYRTYVGGYTGQTEYNTWTAGFLSYEDEASIAAKGKWVRQNQLGGAILWTIGYGSVDGINNPLLNAAKQAFLMGADSVQPFARVSTKIVGTTELRFEFDGSASADANNQPVASYQWDFGDGTSATGAKPVHTYAAEGSYTVALTVTDAAGVSNTTRVSVVAAFPPPPDVMPPLEPVPAANGPTPWVTAYYAGWFWPDHQPQHVDMNNMTHYVFGRVAPGGGTLGGVPGEVVRGAGTAHDAGTLGSISSKSVEDFLVERAHAAGKKALLMIGGMGDGLGFLRSTAPNLRPVFVKNILDYLEAHDYDGIDLDWEDVLDTDQAKFRLTALILDLRAAARQRARWSSPDKAFLITFPNYAMNMNYETVPAWKVTIASIVDQFNLMSYAMGFAADGWVTTTFSPIFGQRPNHPMDLASSIQAYQDAGIDRKKLGIGIGFYGMSYAPPATAPGQAVTSLSSDDVAWSYANLVNGGFLSNGTYHWDDVAKMGYRSYPGGYRGTARYNTAVSGMLSYENEQSISAKGQWVRGTGIGGAIIWVINYGSPDGVTNPLMNAVRQSFLQ